MTERVKPQPRFKSSPDRAARLSDSLQPTSQTPLNLTILTPHTILQLQTIIGNQRVQRLLAQRDSHATSATTQARHEWSAHRSIHTHFDHSFHKYLAIRPAYQAAGIPNPAEFIVNNIVEVSFFGHKSPAHQDLKSPLQQAEAALKAQNITPDIHRFWSFVPRAIRGSTKLSEHAKGRAIDINQKENPRIINADDILVIQAVTGVNMGAVQTAAVLRAASETFKTTFNQAWIGQHRHELNTLSHQKHPSPADHQRITELRQLLRAVRHRHSELRGYARRGMLNLEQSLIDALTNAGFTWGGEFESSKDFMHFELP
jgi:D-alanyl-D-alanine carboxypeptidase